MYIGKCLGAIFQCLLHKIQTSETASVKAGIPECCSGCIDTYTAHLHTHPLLSTFSIETELQLC